MDIALGILNISVSESRTADGQALVDLAGSRGYRLAEVLIIDDETYMPTAFIAERAHAANADAILAPSLEHFGVAARALPYVCALVVPEPDDPVRETSRGQLAVDTRARSPSDARTGHRRGCPGRVPCGRLGAVACTGLGPGDRCRCHS